MESITVRYLRPNSLPLPVHPVLESAPHLVFSREANTEAVEALAYVVIEERSPLARDGERPLPDARRSLARRTNR